MSRSHSTISGIPAPSSTSATAPLGGYALSGTQIMVCPPQYDASFVKISRNKVRIPLVFDTKWFQWIQPQWTNANPDFNVSIRNPNGPRSVNLVVWGNTERASFHSDRSALKACESSPLRLSNSSSTWTLVLKASTGLVISRIASTRMLNLFATVLERPSGFQ